MCSHLHLNDDDNDGGGGGGGDDGGGGMCGLLTTDHETTIGEWWSEGAFGLDKNSF